MNRQHIFRDAFFWVQFNFLQEGGALGRLSFVNNKGFLMDKRLTVPELKVHNPEWYKDKICINSYRWWEQNEARLVAKGPAGKIGSSLSNLRLNISVFGFVKRHRYYSRQTRID